VKLLISGIPLLNPDVGLGTYTFRLIHGLEAVAPDTDFQVVLPHDAEHAIALVPEHRRTVLQGYAPQVPDLIRQRLWYERVCRFARRHPGHIFHSPAPISAWCGPKTFVVTMHDCIYREFPRYLGRRVLRKVLTLASERYAARADMVLTVSEFSKRSLAGHTPIAESRIRVIYNWVDEMFATRDAVAVVPTVRQKYRLPDRYWLYLGGYDYRKNVEHLIRAYAMASGKTECPPLVLAGSIPTDLSKPVCDIEGALADNALPVLDTPGTSSSGSPAVVLPGRIEREDLPGVYAGAELFLFPSLGEGFGMPPMEAAAMGTPSIVMNNSSLSEIGPRIGATRVPNDLEAWTSVLVNRARSGERPGTPPLPTEFTQEHAIRTYLDAMATVDRTARERGS
jgi:glycosyltransferase involved in cell wall biosynthesis